MKNTWCIIALTLLLTGCFSKSQNESNALNVVLSSAPAHLDPRSATDANGMRIGQLIFNGLVKMGPKSEIVSDAATSWTYKDLTYTFQLKPGLTFSDGKPVADEDLRFTFEQYRSEKSPFYSALKIIKEVEVSADSITGHPVVKITLHSFSATLLIDLCVVKILPKATVLGLGDRFGAQPVGTGSYFLKKFDASEIQLQARKNHPIKEPKIENLVFKIIKDENTRYLKLIKGDIDVAQSEIPLMKISSLESDSKFIVHKFPGLSMNYLLLNLKDPLLKELKVRQAIAHAINRSEIIKFKLEGFATIATSILSPVNPFFNASLKPLDYLPQKAKSLLHGIDLSRTELTLKTSNDNAVVENGRVIAKNLSDVGLNVKLQSFEWGTFYQDIQKGNFQIATMRWVGVTDPDIYRIAFHSKELPPGRNRGSYQNSKLDKMLDEGLMIEDIQKRKAHYGLIQEILLNDLPIIPLWYNTQVVVVNSRVKNYQPSLSGDFDPLMDVVKQP